MSSTNFKNFFARACVLTSSLFFKSFGYEPDPSMLYEKDLHSFACRFYICTITTMEEIIHEIAHNNTCQTYFEETFEIDFKCSKEIAIIIKNLENAVSDQKITLRFKITKEEILADVFSKGPLVCKGLSDIKDQVQNEVLKYDRTWKSPLLFAIEQNLQNTYCILSNYGAQIYYDPQND